MGARGVLFGLIEIAALLLLIFGVVTTLQWANAPATPGANDNASAVAAMLTCIERLKPALPGDVELWAVGTGAEEVGSVGMRHLVDTHPEWEADSTFFINFECVGGGSLHWVRTEGTLAKSGYPPMLNELARRLAASGNFGEVTGTDLMAGTDGQVAAERGYPTLSLISLEPNGVPLNYHRIEDTVEAIDCDSVVRAADLGAAVAAAALDGKSAAIVP
jgi:Zn-dependent M28 family amino/carboxypeptidase